MNTELPPSYSASFQWMSVKVPLFVHPNPNGIIIISYPGSNADIDGFAKKYVKIADYLQAKVGSVVRTNNPHYASYEYHYSVQDHLKAVIDYTRLHSQEIAGTPPEETTLYLMGWSAGASGVAAVAYQYPQVSKILLVAPAGDAGHEAVAEGLGQYRGECHIVVGEKDGVIGPDAGRRYAAMATAASRVRVAVIPDCDHHFTGELNGRIMSAAPIWAFQDLPGEQPNPDDGIVLYS